MSIDYPTLPDLDEDYADYILQLNQDDENIRFVAIMNIADEEQPELLAWLHYAAIHDPASKVRELAAARLEGWKDTTSLHTLEWQLRVEDALTIGKLKAVELENILLQQLDDSYWQVRIAVTRSLGLLKAKSAITKLQENFQHDISNLRKEVAIALGEIGGEQAQNILLQHAEDPDPEVRKSIRIGLALIQEKLNAA